MSELDTTGRCPARAGTRLQHPGPKGVVGVHAVSGRDNDATQSHGDAECHVDGAAIARVHRPEVAIAAVRLLRRIALLCSHGRRHDGAWVVRLRVGAVVEILVLELVVLRCLHMQRRLQPDVLEERRPTQDHVALHHRHSEHVDEEVDGLLLVEQQQELRERAQVGRAEQLADEAECREVHDRPVAVVNGQTREKSLDGRDEPFSASDVVFDLDVEAGHVRRVQEHQCEVDDLKHTRIYVAIFSSGLSQT